MRRFIQILALAIAGLLLTTDALGQAQITTRREKLKDFTSKTTKVVLTGDEFLDEAVKESVAATWTVSPYEFCSNEEFQNLKGNADFYFLMVVKGQFRRESEPGIDMLTLVKGGEGADKSINDMFEVVSFPLRSTEDPSGREFVLLPAFLKIIQEHTTSLTDTEMKAYSNIGAKDSESKEYSSGQRISRLRLTSRPNVLWTRTSSSRKMRTRWMRSSRKGPSTLS